MEYPCSTCTRVKDPQNCENKQCKTWREWFIEAWEKKRVYYAKLGVKK